MAINKKLIHFGTKANFKKEFEAGNILNTSIVFIKDAKLIWTHDQYYGYDSIDGDLKDRLDAIDATIEENELITAKALTELNKIKADVEDTIYSTSLGDLTMPNAVGGISAGTSANSLKDKTFTQLFDDLLFPTLLPTYIAPYCTISRSNNTFEVGSTAPVASSFTTIFNRGSISVNDIFQDYRSGELIEAESYIYHTSDTEANKVLPDTVALGNTVYYYKAVYSQGPIPKDNKNNEFESERLEAGSVTSNTRDAINHPSTNKSVTINGTYPWFASTVSAGTYTKQNLVAWNTTAGKMSTGSFTLQPQAKDSSEENRQTFIIPREASTIKTLNTLSGDWVDSSGQWTKTTMTNHYLGRTYYKYHLTSSAANGAQSVQVTF